MLVPLSRSHSLIGGKWLTERGDRSSTARVMGKLYDTIEPKLADWIRRQRLFFVATAPAEGGHVNVSPKGPIGTLRILDEQTVEYDDHVGSGSETAAHLRRTGGSASCCVPSRGRRASSGCTGGASWCRRPTRQSTAPAR